MCSDFEAVWVKVSISSRKHAYVGAFYNPDSSCEALDELDSSLSKLLKKSVKNSVIYLGGDFNLGGDICWETNTVIRGRRYATACDKLLEMQGCAQRVYEWGFQLYFTDEKYVAR